MLTKEEIIEAVRRVDVEAAEWLDRHFGVIDRWTLERKRRVADVILYGFNWTHGGGYPWAKIHRLLKQMEDEA